MLLDGLQVGNRVIYADGRIEIVEHTPVSNEQHIVVNRVRYLLDGRCDDDRNEAAIIAVERKVLTCQHTSDLTEVMISDKTAEEILTCIQCLQENTPSLFAYRWERRER
jgi:hypothetical protein